MQPPTPTTNDLRPSLEALRANALRSYGVDTWEEVLTLENQSVIPTLITDAQYHAFVEIFSVLAHAQWAGWTQYEHSKCVRNADGTMTIPKWAVDRWTRQSQTTYDDLSPEEQESDRNEARKMVELAIKLFWSVT